MLTRANETNLNLSKKDGLQKFSWVQYFILVFAGLFGVLAGLPSVWSIYEKTAAAANIPFSYLPEDNSSNQRFGCS